MSANICFQKGNDFCTVFFEHGGNLAQTEQFAQALQEYSLAKIVKIAATEIKEVDYTTEGSGPFSSVRLFARLYFYCAAEQKTYGCQIAAPSVAMFNNNNSVKKTVGDRLALAYFEFTGKSVTFKEGWLIGDTTEQTA